jgi:hypothetical protein
MARETVKCILCRAELDWTGAPPVWFCADSGCEMHDIDLPDAAARRLSGLSVPRGPMGRPPKTPLFQADGESWWRCACCEEPVPESEMAVDRCWCLECKRKSVADTRKANGRTDRP